MSYLCVFFLIIVIQCEADSTTPSQSDSHSTIAFDDSGNESDTPLFVKDTSSETSEIIEFRDKNNDNDNLDDDDDDDSDEHENNEVFNIIEEFLHNVIIHGLIYKS